jgi:ABC-type multidrug transport system fused ATPase/permease subunit
VNAERLGNMVTPHNLASNPSQYIAQIWITIWSGDPSIMSVQNFLLIYGGVTLALVRLSAAAVGVTCYVAQVLTEYGQSLYLVKKGHKASTILHDDLLNALMKAPMSFFHTHSMGDITSRCDCTAYLQTKPTSWCLQVYSRCPRM